MRRRQVRRRQPVALVFAQSRKRQASASIKRRGVRDNFWSIDCSVEATRPRQSSLRDYNLQHMFQKRRKVERLDFILAGAQKSGTTALHYFLATHPKITMGDQQEMHFFDDDAMFAGPVDYEQLHKHYPALAPSSIAGDCTPSYIYYEPAAQRIWRYNPKIKLL